MSTEDDARDARRRARAGWPIRRFALGAEPADDLGDLTPGERVAMVWRLTRDAWATQGGTEPRYARRDAPGRIFRRP